jgi:hypothetical protein
MLADMSTDDGIQPRQSRPWVAALAVAGGILLTVAFFLLLWLGPIAWQSMREGQRRAEVHEEIRKLQQAVEEYERTRLVLPNDDSRLPAT